MASSLGLIFKSAVKSVSDMDVYSIAGKMGLSSIDDIVSAAAKGSIKAVTVVVDDVVVTAQVTSEGIDIQKAGHKNISNDEIIFVKNDETGEVKAISLNQYLEQKNMSKNEFKNLKHYTFQEYANLTEVSQILKISKGSLINKAIMIPPIVGLSILFPPAIPALLIAGGAYLSLEAVESIKGKLGFEHNETEKTEGLDKNSKKLSELNPVQLQDDKIKEAIKTDFVLSGEILIIALAAMGQMVPLGSVIALAGVGLAATVAVYGTVAGVVKIDDVGLRMKKAKNKVIQKMGDTLANKITPILLKGLEVVGIAAMAAVGGSLFLHNVHMLHPIAEMVESMGTIGGLVGEMGLGVATGLLTLGGVEIAEKINHKFGISEKISKLKKLFKSKPETKTEQVQEVKEESKTEQVQEVKEERKTEQVQEVKEESKTEQVQEVKEESKTEQVQEVKEESKITSILTKKLVEINDNVKTIISATPTLKDIEKTLENSRNSSYEGQRLE